MMVKCLLFLLFIPAFVHGQKIVTDKVDDFDSTRQILTNMETFSIFGFYAVAGARIKDEDATLYLAFYITVGSTLELNQGDKILFKFANNEIYSMPYKGGHQVAFDSQTMTILLPLMDDDLRKLTGSEIAKIRINATNRNIDLDIPPKKTKRLGELIAVVRDRVMK